jgi:hypothetical protein
VRKSKPARPSKPAAPAATETNIFALRSYMAGRGEAPARGIPSTVHPHLRRCLAAGLIEITASETIRLTPAGRAALAG